MRGKLPAVLCPHGHWADGRFYDSGPDGGPQADRRGRRAVRRSAGGIRCKPAACNWRGWAASCSTTTWWATPTASSWITARVNGRKWITRKHWGFFSPQAEARLQTHLRPANVRFDSGTGLRCGSARRRCGPHRRDGGQRRRHADVHSRRGRSATGSHFSGGHGFDGDAGRLPLRKRLLPADRNRQHRAGRRSLRRSRWE